MAFQVTQSRTFRRDIKVVTPRMEADSADTTQTLKVELRALTQTERKACKDDFELVEKMLIRGYDILDADGNEVPEELTRDLLLQEPAAITAIANEVFEVTNVKNFRSLAK